MADGNIHKWLEKLTVIFLALESRQYYSQSASTELLCSVYLPSAVAKSSLDFTWKHSFGLCLEHFSGH